MITTPVAANTGLKIHARQCTKPGNSEYILSASASMKARDYLPHLYGAANYALIDDIAQLPLKVSDIYRRLTSR
ncbi:MAG: hypothetical protein WBN96_10270 [Gammaproteobacteria bacterium]